MVICIENSPLSNELKYTNIIAYFAVAVKRRGGILKSPKQNKEAKGLGKQVLLPHPIPWRGFDGGFLF
jgi:hypothetical protein